MNTIKIDGKLYQMEFVEAAERDCTTHEDIPPYDWENPEWENESRVHNWRNYVSEELEVMWDTFTDVQKKALAISFDRLAS